MKVSTKFEVDTTIRCLVIALLLLIRYVTFAFDLDLWPFDLDQWSYMVGHVVNPSTKFEDPVAIRSWVISSDISHRIPLTMRLQPLRMCRITWPMRSGKFFPHIWNPWPRFAYSLYNFLQRAQCSHCKRCISYSNSVRLSVHPSVTRRYCVKTTARSTVQFALSDSKMRLVLQKPNNIPGDDPFPWNLHSNWPTPADSSESWHLLPCGASTVRDRKEKPITLNKKSTRAFPWAINQGSTPPLTSSKWG